MIGTAFCHDIDEVGRSHEIRCGEPYIYARHSRDAFGLYLDAAGSTSCPYIRRALPLGAIWRANVTIGPRMDTDELEFLILLSAIHYTVFFIKVRSEASDYKA